MTRAIGTAARGSTSREHSEPNLSEVTVTKISDVSTPKLFLDAVAGKLDNKVTIKFTTDFERHRMETLQKNENSAAKSDKSK